MTRLIPEKTVELHSAFSLVSHLGPRTFVWSYTRGIDQGVWSDSYSKLFMLELKAPQDIWNPYFEIDYKQLERYRNNARSRRHPDVLYVFPIPCFASVIHFVDKFLHPPSYPVYYSSIWPTYHLLHETECKICEATNCSCPFCNMSRASPPLQQGLYRTFLGNYPDIEYEHLLHYCFSFPCMRQMFASYSYVVRASALYDFLSQGQSKSRVRIRCDGESILYRSPGRWGNMPNAPTVTSLCTFLNDISSCNEYRGMALRTRDLIDRRPGSEEDIYFDDILLEPASFTRAIQAVGEGHPGRLTFVGWSGQDDDFIPDQF